MRKKQKITGEMIWKGLEEHGKTVYKLNEGQKEVLRKHIFDDIPKLFDDLIGQRITLDTYGKARIKFIQYSIESGLLRELAQNIPDDYFKKIKKDRDFAIKILEAGASSVIIALEYSINEIKIFSEDQKETEKEFILGPELCLSVENITKYLQGKLTIGDVLATQPWVILESN